MKYVLRVQHIVFYERSAGDIHDNRLWKRSLLFYEHHAYFQTDNITEAESKHYVEASIGCCVVFHMYLDALIACSSCPDTYETCKLEI